MSKTGTYLHAELFEINYESLKKASQSHSVYICEPSFQLKTNELFFTEREALWHVVDLLELEGTKAIVAGFDKADVIIAFSKPKSQVYQPFFIEDTDYDVPIHVSEDIKKEYNNDFSVERALVNWSVKDKIQVPLHIEGSTVYDLSTNIAPTVSLNASEYWLNQLKVYLGFSYMFRTFGDKAYLQVLPKSHIAYEESYEVLLNKGYEDKKLLEIFPYVRIMGQSYKVLDMSNLWVDDSISEEPFFGRTFRELAKKMYPNLAINSNNRLIRVGSSHISFYPTSWAYPSLNYTGIRGLSEKYYSNLIGKLKSQSKTRPQSAIKWERQIAPLQIFGISVDVKLIPIVLPYDSRKLTPSDFEKIQNLSTGLIFEPPSVTMLRYGVPTEIMPFVENYQGNVNDLMNHPELKPLDVPKQVNVVSFVYTNLSNSWTKFKKVLSDGVGAYRGFKETFGTELVFKDTIETNFGQDFLDLLRELPISGYHCALVVIPRFLETAEDTKSIYTTAKTKIMSRGIPVQVIADDQTRTMSRDHTLTGKCNDARAMFGLSLNIMAKIGTVLCELSNNVAKNLIANSVVLGYNVGRIVPSATSGIRTIPISAPLVIFDDKGSYVSHQDVYSGLRSEISLFEEHGDKIFSKLPSGVDFLIVHKDGYFFPKELENLADKGRTHGIKVIPVSFRTNNVPRVSNPQFSGFGIGLKAGTVLPLSEEDFLMVTTATWRWDAEKLGWPNPLLITIHNIADPKMKLKILYHIYCLTKIQTGAQRAIRTPISIHYSNMITSFLRKVGDPAPTYIKYFVEENQQGRHIPRWFL